MLKGFFGGISDEPVTLRQRPAARPRTTGIEVRDVNCTDVRRLRQPDHPVGRRTTRISGTLTGRRGEQRIVEIDDHGFDVPPADHMLMVTNDDRPGVIGTGRARMLGNAGVNIADMDVGRADAGTAVMLIATSTEVADGVLEALRAAPGITSVVVLTG